MESAFWWARAAGARFLFYPTLLYSVLRNKLQPEFRWWDEVVEDYKIDHLVIPTRDYLYAPSLADIDRAAAFIYCKNPSQTESQKMPKRILWTKNLCPLQSWERKEHNSCDLLFGEA